MKNLIICGIIASSISFFTAFYTNTPKEENAINIEFVKDKMGNVNLKLYNKSNNPVRISQKADSNSESFSVNARTSRSMRFSDGTKLYWLKTKTPFLVVSSSMEGTEQIIAR